MKLMPVFCSVFFVGYGTAHTPFGKETKRRWLVRMSVSHQVEFVRKHLHLTSTEEHTLLNFALSLIHTPSEELKTDLQVVIIALLRWGADSVINLPDSKGQRPLHLAMKMHSETTIVSHLLDYGAHYDAANAEGKAFYELSEAYRTDIPLPLVCQASRKIVVEAIPYLKLDIPKFVKEFISLHDPKMQVELSRIVRFNIEGYTQLTLYKHGLQIGKQFPIFHEFHHVIAEIMFVG